MKTEKFDVIGMTCVACVSHIQNSVNKLNGIQSVNVNLLTNSMTVTFDEKALDIEQIEKAVERAGYSAHLKAFESFSDISSAKQNDPAKQEQKNIRLRWWLSLGFLLPLMYFSMVHMVNLPFPTVLRTIQFTFFTAFIQLWLVLPIVYINRRYFINGFKSLILFSPNMDSLIAIGSSAAVVYGIYGLYRIQRAVIFYDWHTIHKFSNDLYFESAGTILTLVTLGKYLESKSKNRTTEAITRLINMAPKFATVLRQKIQLEVPVEEVAVGEIVIVRPGQQVPVDGVVLTGSSSVDESVLTGESMPVFKQKGDSVLSASINKSGYFTLKAVKVGKDTTLSQIIRLVEEASSSKAPISKLADKISAIFVPVVIAISLVATGYWLYAGYGFEFSLSIGIAVLVISCPCALGLATPVAIMVGTGKGAENGILIKSAESLQMAGKIDTIVLDKTGTLTEGKPRVTDILPNEGVTAEELLRVAASLEKQSEHPLAEAIMKEAISQKLEPEVVDNFESEHGLGIKANACGKTYRTGNLKYMADNKVQTEGFATRIDKLAEEGKTALLVAIDTRIIGIIAVADVLKAESRQAVEQFRAMGLEVVMLTGDHQRTAEAIASKAGITHVVSELLPQDKDAQISRLQAEGRTVAMIGDGINDAPALMRSQLGIAIGAGTDVAISSADIVLMRSDLLDAVTTLRLSKAVMTNIRQNLFWAFFYNVIGIPLAAGVFYEMLDWKLNPMFAAAAMSFSSVTVVLNALRLLRFKPLRGTITPEKETPGDFPQAKELTNKFRYVMSEKTVTIKGMSCSHCSARVEKALNAIDGVQAKVNLNANTAKLTLTHDVSDETIKAAVDNVGYEVTEIK